jgi:exonuclease III
VKLSAWLGAANPDVVFLQELKATNLACPAASIRGTDAIRARHPTGPVYTFWDYKRDRWARDAGLRLDHLLLSTMLAKRLVDSSVNRNVRGAPGASDHAPAWVVLRRPPRE